MVKMIHRDTGTEMWVHETRVKDYLARGHRLAPTPEPPKPAPKKPRSTKR